MHRQLGHQISETWRTCRALEFGDREHPSIHLPRLLNQSKRGNFLKITDNGNCESNIVVLTNLFCNFNIRGIGGMEIVAMDLKLRGAYMARQLSFQGVKFAVEEVKMTSEFEKMYNEAVDLVCKIYSQIFCYIIV